MPRIGDGTSKARAKLTHLRICVVFEMVYPFFAYFCGFKFITDIFLKSEQVDKSKPMFCPS